MTTYKAVLFDLDGTLLDTLTDLAEATNWALRRLGFPEHPRESFKYFVGDGIDPLLERALPTDHCDTATVAEGARLMRSQYAKRWAATTRPYAGIPELLDALTARHSDGRAFEQTRRVYQAVRRATAERLAIRGRSGEPVRRCPRSPTRRAHARWLVAWASRRPRMVYLGDTSTDMQTATAAGILPVGRIVGLPHRRRITHQRRQAPGGEADGSLAGLRRRQINVGGAEPSQERKGITKSRKDERTEGRKDGRTEGRKDERTKDGKKRWERG